MIFIGYPGIGKSTLAKKHFVIDLESNSFWYKDYMGNKVRDAKWFEYYCNVAENLCEQGFNVFVSSHKDVCRRLKISPYPVVTIYPSLKLKLEWIGKLKKRYDHTGLEKDFKAYTRACSYYEADIHCMMENAPHKHIEITDMNYDLWRLIEPVLWAEREAWYDEKADAMMRGLYICDPEKNYECHKGSSCQELCFLTSDPRFKREEPSIIEQYESLSIPEKIILDKKAENYIINVEEDEECR